MKRLFILGVMATLLIVGVGLVFGLPVNDRAKVASPAINDDGDVIAPPQSVLDLPESQLTKIVFIRYAPAKDKPCNNDGVCDPGERGWCGDCKGNGETTTTTLATTTTTLATTTTTLATTTTTLAETTCYGFLAGSKPSWNWVEGYSYSTADLGSSAASAVSTWEAATSGDIFGSGVSGVYPWGVYDYYNSISYGDYPDPNVIAVTAIWFRGKNIYEYDIQFDTDYFPNAGSPDLDTVVLHEFGHGAGLDDLYNTACNTEVMHGIYDEVDLDLGAGDIAGIRILYGA